MVGLGGVVLSFERGIPVVGMTYSPQAVIQAVHSLLSPKERQILCLWWWALLMLIDVTGK
jgi:hypothetical protein